MKGFLKVYGIIAGVLVTICLTAIVIDLVHAMFQTFCTKHLLGGDPNHDRWYYEDADEDGTAVVGHVEKTES
ncbi:hypothetical protein IKX64_01085 [Candidatus Saccharibacteria bacterium]|nr:hypothetical protein [Candidatus Saccharibacteria bacterium]